MSSPFQTGAAQTQLPPSPEFKAAELSPNSNNFMPSFLLENSGSFVAREEPLIPQRRLRSVARYQAFHPQALACSNVVTSAYSDSSPSSGNLNFNKNVSSNEQGPSSLGAVAGPQGVALFRLSKPHVPLMILSHATNASAGLFSSLSFSDQEDRNLYLGAARGSGVLVWDASGHSSSPLLGRLGVDSAIPAANLSSDASARITSIAWKKGTTSPLLAATTSNTLSIWDIRSAPSGSFRPNLRFGSTAKVTAPTSSSSASATSFVQVACSSDSEECATIDSSGIVRIYDIRMTDRVRAVAGAATSMFPSFDTAGIGIAYFGLQQSSGNATTTSWLTWGIDNLSSPVVKIWSPRPISSSIPVGEEAGAPSSGSAGSGPKTSKEGFNRQQPTPSSSEYHILAKCSRPNLSCARVCPAPIENHFMVMGQNSREQGGWWSELYKLGSSSQDYNIPSNAGVEKVLGFTGGSASADNNAIGSILGNNADIGDLQAVELAFSSTNFVESIQDSENDEHKDIELLVCCLSDSGIFTTHSIPEALSAHPLGQGSGSGSRRLGASPVRVRRPFATRTGFTYSAQAKVYPDDREGTSLFDAAGFWGTDPLGTKTEEAATDMHIPSPTRKLEPNAPVVTGEGLMPFEMDVPVAYGTVAAVDTGLKLGGVNEIGSANVVTSTGVGAAEEAKIGADARDTKLMMENIETERIPCPRLCGASFCKGSGAMVVFQNGEVKKMWNWFQRSDTARIPGTISAKGEAAFSEAETVQTSSTSVSSSLARSASSSSIKMKVASSSEGPRTLKALMNMTEAAKQAQWGEQPGSEASDSDEVAADQYFEDDSVDDDSNSSDSGDDVPSSPPTGGPPDVMQAYFSTGGSGSSTKLDSPPSPPLPNQSKVLATPRKLRFLGPSSETLSPVVRISNQVESLVMSGQSAELAAGFILGIGNGYLASGSSQEEKMESMGEIAARKVPIKGPGLPKYTRSATQTSNYFPRPQSDPNFLKGHYQGKTEQYDEPGVHGGEYSVRPNMEESMTFLRKLFNHQQEGGKPYPTLLSPPDSPMCKSPSCVVISMWRLEEQ